MPISLLPASAAAFAPRSAPTIVLNSKAEPWLTQTLRRVNRIRRPLNSVQQHYRCLNETLSGSGAIWTLCSVILPKAPEAELRKDPNPLVQALFNYQLLHVEAYVVHVDMVSQHEVAFKLTSDTIDALVEYHHDIFLVDAAANTWSWVDKDAHVKKLHNDFVQSVNRYVYRTGVRVLEGLEEDGAGELLEGRSDEVKNAIMTMFQPLLPPPPKQSHLRSALASTVVPQRYQQSYGHCQTIGCTLADDCNALPAGDFWWQPAPLSVSQIQQPTAIESWKVLPSSPSPTLTTCSETHPSFWTTIGMNEIQLPSPTPSFSQPYSTTTSAQFYSPPLCTAPLALLPEPSIISPPCGSTVQNDGFGGFTWGYNDFTPQYATTI